MTLRCYSIMSVLCITPVALFATSNYISDLQPQDSITIIVGAKSPKPVGSRFVAEGSTLDSIVQTTLSDIPDMGSSMSEDGESGDIISDAFAEYMFRLMDKFTLEKDLEEREATPLSEIVVTGTGKANFASALSQNVSVVSKKDISTAYSPSLLPTLSDYIPGLMITERGTNGYGFAAGAAGNMSIRGIGGSPTTGILMLIDGQPSMQGLMGHSLADTYVSSFADHVEVISTPASMMYGSNAMGGVINIITRKPRADEAYSEARLALGSNNLIATDALVSKTEGGVHALLSLNATRSDGHRARMGYESKGGMIKLGYDFSTIWKLAADVNLMRIDANNPGTVTTPMYENEANVTRGMAALTLNNFYSSKTSGNIRAYYSWGNHKVNAGHELSDPAKMFVLRTRDNIAGITANETFQLFNGNSTTFGIDVRQITGRAWNSFFDGPRQGQKDDLCDEDITDIAGYVNVQQIVFPTLSVNAGLRADNHSVSGLELIPQLGANWRVGTYSNLRAVVSKGFRNPTLKDLYLFDVRNPQLDAERLLTYELSYSGRTLSDNPLYYTLATYYLTGDNMIVTAAGRNINSGKVENYGFEAQARYNPYETLRLTANYAYLHTKNPIPAAPEHKLFLRAEQQIKDLRLSASLSHINNMCTDITAKTSETYTLLDASIAYQCNKWVEIYVKGDNLLGQTYEINKSYPMPGATFLAGVAIKM